MGIYDRTVDKTEETAAEFQGSGRSAHFDNVRNITADRLHNAADLMYEKAAAQDAQSVMARYGKQAAGWLDQSAGYVREFDYEQTDAGIRKYIGQNPWYSILIAGGVGLLIGSVFRRR